MFRLQTLTSLQHCLSTISIDLLNDYLTAYWKYFDPQIPIIHGPTFYPQLEDQGLLLMMLAVGESYLLDSGRQLAWVGAALRGKILAENFAHNMPIEMLQTLSLAAYYDIFLSKNASAQFTAECFIATMIAFARQTSVMVRQDKDIKTHSPNGSLGVDGLEWMQWVGEEMKTRVAYAYLVLDGLLPLLRGQVPSRR